MGTKYAEGRRALKTAFTPGKIVHLRIGFQRLYCDERFPTNHLHSSSLNERVRKIVGLSEAFADATKDNIPTWDVYHDPALFMKDFPKGFFEHSNDIEIESELQRLRNASNDLWIRVYGRQHLDFRSPHMNAFEGTHVGQKLRIQGNRAVLISGIFREFAVEETAVAAAQNGFTPFIVENLTVSKDRVTAKTEETSAERAALHNIGRIDAAGVKQILGL